MKKHYVTMTDKFMSGWGMAQGKTNKLIIECANYDQAALIAKNARKRSEMRHVNIRASKPYYGSHVLESWKTFDDMFGSWKE